MSYFLFVYGTLMNNIQSTIAIYLHQNSDFIGEGSFPGKLYDLGSYPGAIYDITSDSCVHGHVFRLHEVENILKRLDFYEGIIENQPDKSEYRRALVPVQVNKDVINSWVYLYNFKTEGLLEIPGGNYLAYFVNNKHHKDFIKAQ